MSWFFFALLAPALYALVVFIDKFIVSKKVKDYRCMPVYASLMGLLSGTVIWFFTGRPVLPLNDAFIVVFAGVLTTISFVMYYKAVLDEDASTINLFFQLGPVFILILAFFFLGEKLNFKQLIGFVVICYSIYGASINSNQKRKKKGISKALIYILIYDILWAISAILMKFALNANSLSQIISYQNWGVALGGVGIFLLVPSIRLSFLTSVKTIKTNVVGMMLSNELLFVLARTVTYIAYSLGSVAVVGLLEGTQVFYGILYGWLFTLLAPTKFSEDINKKTIRRKIFFAVLLFVGIILVH